MRGDEQIVFTAGDPPLRCGLSGSDAKIWTHLSARADFTGTSNAWNDVS